MPATPSDFLQNRPNLDSPLHLPSTGWWDLKHPQTYGDVGVAAWALAWVAFYGRWPALVERHDPAWMPSSTEGDVVFQALPEDIRGRLDGLGLQVERSRDKVFNLGVALLREALVEVG